MRVNTHYKITFVFSFVTALTLVACYLALKHNLRAYSDQSIRTSLKSMTLLSKYRLDEISNDQKRWQQFDEISDQMGKDLKLRVTMIASDGRVLGDSELEGQALREVENHANRPEIQEARSAGFGESVRFSTTVNKNMLYMAMPFGSGQSEGIIRLSLPLSEIELILAQMNGVIAFSLFAVFILAMMINFFASAYISKPIREISKTANRIAQGDFSKIDTHYLNDEIGDLGDAFNEMSEQLENRLQEMRLSHSRLEAVLLSMLEGVLVVDPKGTILLMNPALRDFFQIKQDARGKNSIEVIRNLEIAEIIDCAVNSRCRLDACEISIVSPEEKILSVYASPVMRDNRPEGAILVFHDNTNVRRLEKIRQDFVANVSHELKTPVASIKGYAETLLEGALDDRENAHTFLKIIYDDSERLATLIDDLLNLSKIESGKLNMNLKPVDLVQIVKKVVKSMQPQFLRQSIKIDIETPTGISPILADEARIMQVFFNLVDNAIKYNTTNGEIRVRVEEEETSVKIEISDNGIGIPEADLPRVFERFYRVDKGRSRALGGTGLGLSIVKHIVKAHNGDITVKSTLRKGSAFTLTFPKTS